MGILKALLRAFSYIFEGLLALFAAGISCVALMSHSPLNLTFLPWTGEKLTQVLLPSVLAGLLLALLAMGGRLRALFFLWSVAVFAVLQTRVRSAELIALLPRPLYRVGTAFALSLAFAPKTIASFQALREARRLRGQQTGWRSAPGLLVPLLLTTLEQALQYGESLDARGYGSQRRSRYRPVGWSLFDAILVATSLTALILNLTLTSSSYNPYVDLAPRLPSGLSLLAIMLLAAPALTTIPRMNHAPDHA